MEAREHTAFGVVVRNARPLCDRVLPVLCLGIPRAAACNPVVEVVGIFVEEDRLSVRAISKEGQIHGIGPGGAEVSIVCIDDPDPLTSSNGDASLCSCC